MYQYKKTAYADLSVKEAFDFSTNIYNICMMVPAYIKVRIIKGNEHLKLGDMIKLKVKISGISFFWESVIVEYEENEYFLDRMLRGPFKSWEHRHHFKKSGKGTKITDIVDYDIPFGIIGGIANSLFIKSMVESIFTFRHDFDVNKFISSKNSCEI